MSSCDQGLLVRGHRAFLSFLLEPYKLSLLPLGLVPSRDDLSMLFSLRLSVHLWARHHLPERLRGGM